MSGLMSGLNIEKVEHGFIATADDSMGVQSRKWAFETAQTMADFILGWRSGAEEVESEKRTVNSQGIISAGEKSILKKQQDRQA